MQPGKAARGAGGLAVSSNCWSAALFLVRERPEPRKRFACPLGEILGGHPLIDTELGPPHVQGPEDHAARAVRRRIFPSPATGASRDRAPAAACAGRTRRPHILTAGMRRAQLALYRYLPLIDWPRSTASTSIKRFAFPTPELRSPPSETTGKRSSASYAVTRNGGTAWQRKRRLACPLACQFVAGGVFDHRLGYRPRHPPRRTPGLRRLPARICVAAVLSRSRARDASKDVADKKLLRRRVPPLKFCQRHFESTSARIVMCWNSAFPWRAEMAKEAKGGSNGGKEGGSKSGSNRQGPEEFIWPQELAALRASRRCLVRKRGRTTRRNAVKLLACGHVPAAMPSKSVLRCSNKVGILRTGWNCVAAGGRTR